MCSDYHYHPEKNIMIMNLTVLASVVEICSYCLSFVMTTVFMLKPAWYDLLFLLSFAGFLVCYIV